MFFRPSFCANCGEKIERADWGMFTSRRFCQVCETEFKGQDLIPRAIVGGSVVLAILGTGAYLRSGNSATSALVQPNQVRIAQTQRPSASQLPTPLAEAQNAVQVPRTLVSPPANAVINAKPAADEISYYCGAETKKGTFCTRRVKGNIRCFQHKGMPAILPPEKLRIG